MIAYKPTGLLYQSCFGKTQYKTSQRGRQSFGGVILDSLPNYGAVVFCYEVYPYETVKPDFFPFNFQVNGSPDDLTPTKTWVEGVIRVKKT